MFCWVSCNGQLGHFLPITMDYIILRNNSEQKGNLSRCTVGCPILVKSLNLVPVIRVPIRIDILGRFLHFQSFRATFTIPQLTCKCYYILIIFALREDLTCHFSITYCLRYQGDRVLFRLFCIIYQSVILVHTLNK